MLRRPTASVLLTAVLLAGCGSTVQQTSGVQSAAGGDGLSQGGGLSPQTGGASGTTSGSVGSTGSSGNGANQGGPGPVGPATSGGGNASSGAGAASSGGTLPPPTAKTTGPVKVGFVVDNSDSNGAASALGATNGNSFTIKQSVQSIVAAVNARGGVAGRKVDPVYFGLSTTGDYKKQYGAACETFTHDNKVAAVWSNLNYLDTSFETCLAKAGVAHIEGSFATADAQLAQQLPLLVSTGAPTLDRTYVGVLEGLTRSGYLTAKNKLGVVVESCPQDQRVLEKSVTPAISRLGLKLADTQTTDCTTGFSGAGSAANRLSGAVLSFASKGVDRVMFISSFEATAVLLFSNAAESQQYRPGYALSTAAGPAVLGSQLASGQAANLHGMGWAPALDVNAPTSSSSATLCLKLHKSQGLTPKAGTDRFYLLDACDALFLLDAALRRTGGATASRALTRGVEALGSSFVGALALDGSTSLKQGHHDAPVRARAWAWDTSCSCSRYTGTASAF